MLDDGLSQIQNVVQSVCSQCGLRVVDGDLYIHAWKCGMYYKIWKDEETYKLEVFDTQLMSLSKSEGKKPMDILIQLQEEKLWG